MKRFTALLGKKSVQMALGGSVVAFSALAISFGGVTSSTIASALRDPLSILGDRSPGARGGGSLAGGKLSAVKLANVDTGPVGAITPSGPTQRVLSGARPAQPVVAGASGPAPGFVGSVPTSIGSPGGGFVGSAPAGGVIPGPIPGGGGGGVFFPPSGGGGGGGGGVVPQPPAIVPVPEPTTWAMMILGFGMIGAMLRRRARPTASTDDGGRVADA